MIGFHQVSATSSYQRSVADLVERWLNGVVKRYGSSFELDYLKHDILGSVIVSGGWVMRRE